MKVVYKIVLISLMFLDLAIIFLLINTGRCSGIKLSKNKEIAIAYLFIIFCMILFSLITKWNNPTATLWFGT